MFHSAIFSYAIRCHSLLWVCVRASYSPFLTLSACNPLEMKHLTINAQIIAKLALSFVLFTIFAFIIVLLRWIVIDTANKLTASLLFDWNALSLLSKVSFHFIFHIHCNVNSQRGLRKLISMKLIMNFVALNGPLSTEYKMWHRYYLPLHRKIENCLHILRPQISDVNVNKSDFLTLNWICHNKVLNSLFTEMKQKLLSFCHQKRIVISYLSFVQLIH